MNEYFSGFLIALGVASLGFILWVVINWAVDAFRIMRALKRHWNTPGKREFYKPYLDFVSVRRVDKLEALIDELIREQKQKGKK